MLTFLEYDLKINSSDKIEFKAGFKINTANKIFAFYNGYGTNDFIIGSTYTHNHFNVGLYSQIPMHEFRESQYNFRRGADISFDVGYSNSAGKLNYKLELLGIKRLAESVFNYHPFVGTVISPDTIAGSDFFQLNAAGEFAYSINKTSMPELALHYRCSKDLKTLMEQKGLTTCRLV